MPNYWIEIIIAHYCYRAATDYNYNSNQVNYVRLIDLLYYFISWIHILNPLIIIITAYFTLIHFDGYRFPINLIHLNAGLSLLFIQCRVELVIVIFLKMVLPGLVQSKTQSLQFNYQWSTLSLFANSFSETHR